MIYLISTDGYLESLITEHYATNRKEIELIITKEIRELHNSIIRNFEIYPDGPFKKPVVSFEYFDEHIEEWSLEKYHIISIEKVTKW